MPKMDSSQTTRCSAMVSSSSSPLLGETLPFASPLLRETLPLTALPTADTGYLIGISNIRRQFTEFYKAAHDQFHSFAKFFTMT